MENNYNRGRRTERSERSGRRRDDSGRQEDGSEDSRIGFEMGRGSRACLTSLIYVLAIVGISILLAAVVIMSANEVFALTKQPTEATVTLSKDETLSTVATKLKEAGVINSPFLFRTYAKFKDQDTDFVPGTYKLSADLEYSQVLQKLRYKPSGGRTVVSVTVPEGTDLKKVIEILAAHDVSDRESLWEAAKNYDFQYSFLIDMPKSEKRLEGFLFPDTYQFYKNDNPEKPGDSADKVFNKFLSNYSRKVTPAMKERAEELGYSMYEILTIASIIEKEAKTDEDRGKIASVIYNRLKSETLKKLQIDATVLYALGVNKPKVTYEDLEVESPYNTYKYEGLPPGPISNPGEACLRAALYPDNTKYYYYVALPDGTHIFSKSGKDHEKAVAEAQKAWDESNGQTTP